MLKAMIEEMKLRSDFFEHQPIQTLYIGGGTPSILNETEINMLVLNARKIFNINSDAEISIEANPEDISSTLSQTWKDAGINRVSLGIQSLDEKTLIFLNRGHNRESAIHTMDILRDSGFNNISIDVITGIPGLDHQSLIENLERLCNKKPEHFSVYSLTIEDKTLLGYKRNKGQLDLNDEHSAEQYQITADLLKSNNYFPYEVSNFASENKFISKHNSSYWKMIPYLGIGPSAHSFNGKSRFKNYPNNALYIKSIKEGKLHGELEILSGRDIFNDTLLTGLRTIWGVDHLKLESMLGAEEKNKFSQAVNELLQTEDLIQEDKIIRIPEKKFIISDSILLKLLL